MKLKERLLKEKISPRTYLEIAKIHDKEIPISNLLAYFFRPREKHGLGTLFLEALLQTECYSLTENKSLRDNLYEIEKDEDALKNIKVTREYPVKNKNPKEKAKRIDLLIETKKLVVCIEFKINKNLDNPLELYKEEINTNFPNKKKLFVVLSPTNLFKDKKIDADVPKFLNKDTENPFVQIILTHFIKKIDKLHKKQKPQNTEEYFFFKDFKQTLINRSLKIKNKQEETIKKIIQEAGLTIENAEIKPSKQDNEDEIKLEFWNEILILIKLKELNEKLGNNFKLLKRERGYFLEKKTTKYNFKIRIEDNNWLIEKWSSDNKFEEEIKNLCYNTEFEEIKGILKTNKVI